MQETQKRMANNTPYHNPLSDVSLSERDTRQQALSLFGLSSVFPIILMSIEYGSYGMLHDYAIYGVPIYDIQNTINYYLCSYACDL